MGAQALLVMDVQRRIMDRFGDEPGYLDRLRQAIATARGRDIPVIYVVVGFRDGYPEVSPHNAAFSGIASTGAFRGADESAHIHSAIAPADGDVIVTKKRVSAFAGSDLELLLRARGIDTLILTGIATSGVVLSTLRQAADLDFVLTVLSDACLDADDEVHRVLTEKVFPRQAQVLDVETWSAAGSS